MMHSISSNVNEKNTQIVRRYRHKNCTFPFFSLEDDNNGKKERKKQIDVIYLPTQL
jgi:hypothetical protein